MSNFIRKSTASAGILSLFFLVFFFNSCQRTPTPNPIAPVAPPVAQPDQRDSLRDLAKFFYYWNENIPSSFNPLAYQLYIASADSSPELEAIKLYSPFNSVNNLHYDHFSFLLTEAQYQAEFVTGVSKRFGMNFSQDRNGAYRISYCAHASPAYSQGVRRGFVVDSINGIALNANLTQAQINTLNSVLQNGPSATFAFIGPGSSKTFDLNISQGTFGDDEVIGTNITISGSKKIGYISYNTFLTQYDSVYGAHHQGLDTAFSHFAAQGITDLIVDLRYNGGGYVSVAEQMDNAMLPQSANGSVLYSQKYNDSLNYYHKYYKNGNNSIAHDTTVYINKTDSHNPSSLTLNNVVFIVSNNTASAAELVINDLKPYFTNLKIVGLGKSAGPNAQRSAGKPFGYAYNFGLPSKNPSYEAFIINFESKNALGADDYVSGFTPDFQTYDGVEYNWGDPNEDGFKAGLAFLETGTFATIRANNQLAFGGKGVAAGRSIQFLGSNFFGESRRKGMFSPQKKGFSLKTQILQLQKARAELNLARMKNPGLR